MARAHDSAINPATNACMTTSASQPLIDALAQKAARIERCLQRVQDEYQASSHFDTDFTHQDAAILNIQRACELAIDMGNMVVSHEKWGLPRSAKDMFATLGERGLIGRELSATLQNMVGFRNVAVHDYEELEIRIVEAVIKHEIQSLAQFAGIVLAIYALE